MFVTTMSQTAVSKEPSRLLIFAAFAALYIIWGSTYIGIRIAIESIPPFFTVGARFLSAGLILFVWAILKGEKTPGFSAFLTISVGGILMLFIGNGAVTYAEQYLPSGLAAIVVATVPLWFVILDKKQWHFYFSNKLIIVGILIGFAGVLMLFAGKGTTDFFGDTMKLTSFFILIAGTIGWAVGSLYSKYKTVDASVTMKAAGQMIAAGIVSVLVGLLSREQNKFSLALVTTHSILALLYLIVMGSLVAFMSYIWLLSVLPPSVVGTYAYANPVVAVFLGWLMLNEPITRQQVIALAVILAGVILVNVSKEKKVTEEKKV